MRSLATSSTWRHAPSRAGQGDGRLSGEWAGSKRRNRRRDPGFCSRWSRGVARVGQDEDHSLWFGLGPRRLVGLRENAGPVPETGPCATRPHRALTVIALVTSAPPPAEGDDVARGDPQPRRRPAEASSVRTSPTAGTSLDAGALALRRGVLVSSRTHCCSAHDILLFTLMTFVRKHDDFRSGPTGERRRTHGPTLAGRPPRSID